MNWFNKNDLKKLKLIYTYESSITGYVLPHAGTKYTGHILSHSLRFVPKNYFTNILILYYPANNEENIILNNNKYFHEYYVLMKTLQYFTKYIWNFGEKSINGINVRDIRDFNLNFKNTLVVLSADFSHFLPMQEAIVKENCAAHSLLHRKLDLPCTDVIDMIDTFKLLYEKIPDNFYLQWIGRTRSSNLQGVGYLSFLIQKPVQRNKTIDGIFVTAYDEEMRQRECLGEWFTVDSKYSKIIESNLLEKVINLARSTSRLTGGEYLNIPVNNYTITYLYKDKSKKFIRGYHGIKKEAFYLPDVMLENAYNNGKWINPKDKTWPKDNKFKMKNTLRKIKEKGGKYTRKQRNYELYFSDFFYGIL